MRQIFFSGLFCLIFCSQSAAQTLELLAPAQNVTVTEGDDYATTVLNNPWDCAERRDIGWENNFVGQSIAVSSGIWSGVNESAGAHLFPLFGGFYGSLLTEGTDGDRSLPRFGANHPIDTSRYSLLSYRLKNSARGTYAVYWRSNGGASYWPDGSQFGANYDGIYLTQAVPNIGYQLYQFDLRSPRFEQSSGGWNGSVVALRIDPSVGAPAGARTDLDWVRLVDPESAPTVDITWSSAGLPQGSVVTVWLDSDASGFDGTPLARYAHGSSVPVAPGGIYSTSATPYRNLGSHQLKTALLPPGDYYIYVTAERFVGSALQQVAASGYSARLRVRAAPSAYFISPSAISGADYATTELGNSWDMSDAADVANLPGSSYPAVQRQFSNASFADGVFQATADTPLYSIGNVQSDAQVYLNGPPSRPIKPSRYRYLTYRLAIDGAQYPSASAKAENGLVSRPVFWDGDLFGSGGSAKAHMVFEGYHTYTIDLWDPTSIETGLSWLSLGSIRQLRIDPLETTLPTWFFIDWVKLTAPDAPSEGQYQFRFVLEDADSSGLSVSLYLDSDHSGFDGAWLGSLDNVAPGEHSIGWDASATPDGTYFPYVEVSDGSQVRRFYSSAPLVVGGVGGTTKPVRYDYNGDGRSDHVVYRPSEGTYYLNKSLAGPSVSALGPVGGSPIEGDFDGDGISDIATVSTHNGILYWLIQFSSNHTVSYRPWGIAGDIPVVGDYDGDKRDDIAVYRGGQWFITFLDGTVRVGSWGYPGDVPLAADFDGDSRVDYAIWRNGDWWILYSGFAAGYASNYYAAVQWGLPGDLPIGADFTNDGRADYVVWRPSEGNWYIHDSQSDAVSVSQWGLPGDIPVAGNFLGSTPLDLTVWRPSLGIWFSRDTAGNVAVTQWGLPADALPR